MADIVIINPRFDPSFWGMEYALPLFGKKAVLPVASLPLLAALTPKEHSITLVDENIEPLDFDTLARADIVGVTGMIVQRARMREILRQLKERDAFTVVGGPWVSVSEDYFGNLADVVFVGEAEQTWPEFLREWQAGQHARRYEQQQRTDLSQVPCPRYDLLKSRDYAFAGVQFTRGCPFRCEFCDIIVTFGRRPRLKTAAQVVTELEALLAVGLRLVFIVDDNLIGNKKAVKQILGQVIAWQRRRGYPLTFFTQATLDLAEDEELMELMVAANIQSVFIGIETPNPASLRETRKLQNVRQQAGTMLERVHRIQSRGMEIWCGMILGFDHDDETIFDAQLQFLTRARIVHVMLGILVAIPKTPLYARLAAVGRLDENDPPSFGTNVIPLQLSRQELSQGYVRVMKQLYDCDAYFDRVDSIFLDPNFNPGAGQRQYGKDHSWVRLQTHVRNIAAAGLIQYRLRRVVKNRRLRRYYDRKMTAVRRRRKDPHIAFIYALKCATHYHYHTMVQQMSDDGTTLVNSF